MDDKIDKAQQSVERGNNGYADIGNDPEVVQGLIERGFTVIRSTNLHGRPTHKAFTKQAQERLKGEPFAVSTYRPPASTIPGQEREPDYEAAILERQEWKTLYM